MVYEIKRISDSKTWYVENPAFVRMSDDAIYCLTSENEAHAVYVEGTCFHILGRAPIQGLDDVTVGISGNETYSNIEVKGKLDEYSNILDDIITAITPMEAN